MVDKTATPRKVASQGLAPLAAAASIPLIQLYRNQYYGDANSTIWVSDPCDSAGYRLTLNSYWRVNVSSLGWVHQSCNRARTTNLALNAAATWVLSTPVLGSFDNNVNHMQVFQG